MSRDFTLTKYRELCQTLIASGYEAMTVADYLASAEKPARLAILRHDVDRKPGNALEMAGLEKELGLRATYYFRYNRNVFKRDLITKIAGMGHEIGYHYETLDKARGDYDRAAGIFRNELTEFRKIAPVQTICMHGNPLTRWDNRDLWKRYDFREFGLVGEAYLSFDAAAIAYFSDTGRTWSERHKVKDRLSSSHPDGGPNNNIAPLDSTDSLLGFLRDGKAGSVYLTVHPERWSNEFGEWAYSAGWDSCVNAVKRCYGAVIKLLNVKR